MYTQEQRRSHYRKALAVGGVLGLVLGVATCLAFGVFDVQCRADPSAPNWNAQLQRCEK